MPLKFIEKIAPLAIKHGNENNILPSLIISQSCLESSYGKSENAVKANNLFGIKKGDNWQGDVYSKKTAEYYPDGKKYYITSLFRKYKTIEGSVIDLCEKYIKGLTWEKHNRYQAVVGETNYKKATLAVFKAGYASDPNYPSKLNSIIEKYNLTQYDKNISTPKPPNPTLPSSTIYFKPSTPTFKKEVISFLEKARKKGVLSSNEWEKKALENKLPLNDLIALIATFIGRSIK